MLQPINKHKPCLKSRRRQRGFTLLEVMVALIIVAVALPALLYQVSTITDQTAFLRDKALAQWVAQNKMYEFRLIKQLTGRAFKGTDSGDMEMATATWRWEAKAENTPLADSFKNITISVYRGQEKDPLVVFEGIMSE
jgi:general secretion pathway protein I